MADANDTKPKGLERDVPDYSIISRHGPMHTLYDVHNLLEVAHAAVKELNDDSIGWGVQCLIHQCQQAVEFEANWLGQQEVKS